MHQKTGCGPRTRKKILNAWITQVGGCQQYRKNVPKTVHNCNAQSAMLQFYANHFHTKLHVFLYFWYNLYYKNSNLHKLITKVGNFPRIAQNCTSYARFCIIFVSFCTRFYIIFAKSCYKSWKFLTAQNFISLWIKRSSLIISSYL